MWIGSPLRGAFRLVSYLLLTLVLLPFYLLARALGISARRMQAICDASWAAAHEDEVLSA